MKNLLIWAFALIGLATAFNLLQGSGSSNEPLDVSYSRFTSEVASGNVREVVIVGEAIEGRLADGRKFETYAPNDPTLVQRLESAGVNIVARPRDSGRVSLFGVFVSWFPMLLLIAVWVFFMRQMQGGGKGSAMGFGRSRARLMNDKQGKVTFRDVAGIDEAKAELQEIVDFLRDPSKFQRLGGKIPKGALLVGPPGTGKTLLARAIAGEADAPFFSISGSDFVELFVGVGASRVRDMFEQARKQAPCIIFIDEIDAVGRHRGAGMGGGNDEREQTLNQLLVEMDGFDAKEGVIIIAATNRPDVLDPALLRPGRFDRQVVVSVPDINGRERILGVHAKKVTMNPSVDLRVVARGTPGFSGADLANLINESALLAARADKRSVGMRHLEEAKDRIMMGTERKLAMTDEDRRLTAYHEGGHAIVSLNAPGSDPIHKATIVPRGRALGMVVRLPERDQFSHTREKLEADLAVAMGGRVAEEMIFGAQKVTSGASSDIRFATQLARSMVTEYGMSERMGPLSYHENDQEVFLGRSIARHQHTSEKTQEAIDAEVRALVEAGLRRARGILRDKEEDLHTLAKALLKHETLSGENIATVLRGEAIKEPEPEPEEAPQTETPPRADPDPYRSAPSVGSSGWAPERV